jgi:hypothetical protein
MNDDRRLPLQETPMRVTCYVLFALALIVSVVLSIYEILR